MAVTAIDVEARLSGGATNFDPTASLGGVMSDDFVSNGLIENLFDDVTSGEASAGDTEYRCYYVRNDNAVDDATDIRVYVSEDTPSAGTVLDIGLDPAGKGNGVTTGVATTVANESTAPAAVVFTHPTTFAGGLALGLVAAGEGQAVWVRRTVSVAATAAPRDDAVITHGVDTT